MTAEPASSTASMNATSPDHEPVAAAGDDRATHLLVIRHGQSEWNAAGRGHGWGDPPLSALGREQAQSAVAALSRQGLEPGVVSSDLVRARHTARVLADALDLGPVEVTPDLREHNIGEWDGLTWDEIERTWPGVKARWVSEELDQAPGGEHRADFHARVRRAIDRVARERPGARRLVVAHGGVVRALEDLAATQRHAIDFLSGRWFIWHRGELRAGEPFLAVQPTGRDF